ncbi:MAG: ATP-binding protein, partial [Bacteroidales bacterium]|nr:ATP-binding protein [Bacteroidales bacterium]
ELEKRNLKINNQKDQIQEQAQQLISSNIELEKLSIVAEKTNNAVVILDKHGDIEWVNNGFERMLGYNRDEFVARSGRNFIEASSFENSEIILNQCINEKKSVSYNCQIATKSGDMVWLQSTITPVLKDNKIEKIVVIDADISELKKAEDKILRKNLEIQEKAEKLKKQANDLQNTNKELEKQKDRAEVTLRKLKNTQSQLVSAEKMASLGQLTSGIAHEINNPINYISSSIDGLGYILSDIKLLLSEYDKTISDSNANLISAIKEELEYDDMLIGFDELTQNIKMGIDKTKEIVNSLRTFSRVDEDNFVLVNIHQNIDSAIILMGKLHSDRIIITKNYGNIPEIPCIPGKISQVFLNILVNAIQAIHETGKINISTKKSTKNNKEYVNVTIDDTGVGMTKEVTDKIFEPFFTTKDVGEGTGLGLSITYSIIKKHNALIDVKSEPGVGTSFSLLLPVSQKN